MIDLKRALTLVLALGCGKRDSQGLPPASDWEPSANASVAGARADPVDDPRARFVRCFAAEIMQAPEAANAMTIFARTAPAREVRAVVGSIARDAQGLSEGERAKVLGEAAWALAEVGASDDARAIARGCTALLQDGQGGRLTCLAVLGRLDTIAEARVAATQPMMLDAIAFGAAVARRDQDARVIVAEIEGDPAAKLYVRSAIHLKTRAALGDVAYVTAALAAQTGSALLLDAGAVVEGGAHRRNDAVMHAGVAALARATDVTTSAKARALLGAAGTAAAAKSRVAVDDAIAQFEQLGAEARVGLELVPVAVYATLGDVAEARRRFGPGGDAVDRQMFTAGLAAISGQWDDLPARVPANAVLAADLWGHALAAKLDPARAGRVLDTFCPR